VSQSLINGYLHDLKISPIEGTQLVVVSVTTQDPDLSAQLANAHVREFIRRGVELSTQTSEQAKRFLDSKLTQLKHQLEASEVALNEYRRNKGIIPGLISVDGKEDVVLDRLNKLSQDLEEAHLQTITLGAQITLINEGHAEVLPAAVDSDVIHKLKEQMTDLETQYAGMAGRYKPAYPAMAQLRAKLQETTIDLKRETEAVVGAIRTQYLGAEKKEEALEAELKQQKDFALGLNDAAVKYVILQRETDTNRELYNAVLKRMKDVEVTADVHASNVSVVDMAVPPLTPSSPRTELDLVAALALGLMGGIGGAFLIEYLDNTLKNPDQAESFLQIPTLGLIPNFSRLDGRLAYGRPLPAAQADTEEVYSRELIVARGKYSGVGESYRTFRSALLLSRPGSAPKTILITSAIQSEGKTVTAANTAIILAHTGKRVLLVDADLRRPRCHKILSTENHLGLTEILTGAREWDQLIRTTRIENLSLLSSGVTPPNPSELLGSDKMQELLTLLVSRYDYVVIDGTPIIPVSDALAVSTMVDGVVLIVGAGTPKQQVKAALSRLQYVHAKVFGSVLNKMNVHSAGYHYHSYNYGDTKTLEDA